MGPLRRAVDTLADLVLSLKAHSHVVEPRALHGNQDCPY